VKAKRARITGILVAMVALTPMVWAQDEPLPDRFKLEIGGFFITTVESAAQLTRSVGPIQVGGAVDFNEDLGLKGSDTVPRLDGAYLFSKRHGIEFSYWNIDRDATTQLERDIEFGNIGIAVGEEVSSYFDMRTFRVSYGYALYSGPKVGLGINAGLYTTRYGLGIACNSCNSQTAENVGVTTPLPVVGFNCRYQLSRRWRFAGYTQLFFLEYAGYEGSLTDTRITFSHHTFKNVGFGFGWNRIHTDIDVDTSDYVGFLDSRVEGLQAYVVLSFGKLKFADP